MPSHGNGNGVIKRGLFVVRFLEIRKLNHHEKIRAERRRKGEDPPLIFRQEQSVDQ